MWTFSLILLLLGIWLLYRKHIFSYFKELGIPGPTPNLVFGNILDIVIKNPIKCHQEWVKKYGKVVGYYFGTSPVILVADVDLLKKIQISDFQKFIGRSNFQRTTQIPRNTRVEGFSEQLVTVNGKQWKDARSILTPSFTTSKMKQMAPSMITAIHALLSNIRTKSLSREPFNIYQLYKGLTMDVIGRTAFGIQTDVQNNPNDPVFRAAQTIFSHDIKNPIIIFMSCFRSLETIWNRLRRLALIFLNEGTDPVAELVHSTKKVIATRRQNKESRRPDLLQLMLDAEEDIDSVSSEDLIANAETETNKSVTTSSKTTKKMSDAGVLDNSVLFFLAAYETTSTSLAFITHVLVNYPEAQEKIRQEIKDVLKSEGELNYHAVNKMQYLEQVINETLRLYPPIFGFVTRVASQDVDFGKVHIKKGTPIQVAVYNLHRDPELWEEPDKFRPERFSPENKGKIHPLAFQPFGAGPRNCIGMRFALMEIKLAIAHLLFNFKLEACAKTENEENLTLHVSQILIKPTKGIWVVASPVNLDEI